MVHLPGCLTGPKERQQMVKPVVRDVISRGRRLQTENVQRFCLSPSNHCLEVLPVDERITSQLFMCARPVAAPAASSSAGRTGARFSRSTHAGAGGRRDIGLTARFGLLLVVPIHTLFLSSRAVQTRPLLVTLELVRVAVDAAGTNGLSVAGLSPPTCLYSAALTRLSWEAHAAAASVLTRRPVWSHLVCPTVPGPPARPRQSEAPAPLSRWVAPQTDWAASCSQGCVGTAVRRCVQARRSGGPTV